MKMNKSNTIPLRLLGKQWYASFCYYQTCPRTWVNDSFSLYNAVLLYRMFRSFIWRNRKFKNLYKNPIKMHYDKIIKIQFGQAGMSLHFHLSAILISYSYLCTFCVKLLSLIFNAASVKLPQAITESMMYKINLAWRWYCFLLHFRLYHFKQTSNTVKE